MSHPEEGMFHAWLDGELSPDEVRAIETHVASCSACAIRLDEVRAIFAESTDLVERLELPEREAPSPAALAPQQARARRPWALTGPRMRTLAWAATIVIAAGAGYLAGDWRQRVPGRAPAVISDETGPVATPASEEALRNAQTELSQSELADSTAVTEVGKDQPAGQASRAGGGKATQPRRGSETAAPTAPRPVDVVGGVAGAPAEGQVRDELEAPAPALAPAPVPRRDLAAQNAPGEAREGGRAEAERRQAPVSQLAEDARREQDFAKAAEPAPAAAFRTEEASPRQVTLEQAVDVLNGAIRLVEGASLTRVEISDPPALPWAQIDSPLVRVVYQLEGTEVVLSQMRVNTGGVPTEEGARAAAKRVRAARPVSGNEHAGMVPNLAPGDTLVVAEPGGGYRVWWLDGSSRVLSLSGPLGQEALRRIVERIR